MRNGSPGRHVNPSKAKLYGSFSNTATFLRLSEVNGALSHPGQRSRSRKLVILVMRSGSDGHT